MADVPTPTPTWDVRDDRIPPASARALARAAVLSERAQAAAQRRRRGFGVRPPASMPDASRVRRRVVAVA
jgi:hypothetical protein